MIKFFIQQKCFKVVNTIFWLLKIFVWIEVKHLLLFQIFAFRHTSKCFNSFTNTNMLFTFSDWLGFWRMSNYWSNKKYKSTYLSPSALDLLYCGINDLNKNENNKIRTSNLKHVYYFCCSTLCQSFHLHSFWDVFFFNYLFILDNNGVLEDILRTLFLVVLFYVFFFVFFLKWHRTTINSWLMTLELIEKICFLLT